MKTDLLLLGIILLSVVLLIFGLLGLGVHN